MSKKEQLYLWIGAAALVVLAAGGFMTASARDLLRAHASFVVRANEEFRTLELLRRRVDRVESARRLVESTPADAQAALPSSLLQSALKECRVDLVKDERQDAVPGWVIRRQRLAIADVAAGQLMPVLAKLDAVRPPWRLRRIAAQASARGAGFVRVELLFETLERSGG